MLNGGRRGRGAAAGQVRSGPPANNIFDYVLGHVQKQNANTASKEAETFGSWLRSPARETAVTEVVVVVVVVIYYLQTGICGCVWGWG